MWLPRTTITAVKQMEDLSNVDKEEQKDLSDELRIHVYNRGTFSRCNAKPETLNPKLLTLNPKP